MRSYSKKVFLLIIVFLVLRIVTGSVLELGNDESYYWLYSKHLQWNYFDHPPMIALWLRIFTLNGLLFDYEIFLRLGSVVSCACSTWFVYKAVAEIKSERAGWFAACIFNTSLYAGIVAGVLIMPDSPQLFFWTFCLWQIAKLMTNEDSWATWLLFGISAGLCSMSKIHGGFIWIGVALYVICRHRAWLRNPKLYVALLVSLVIISPVLFWNFQYDFVTWKFHSARIVPLESSGVRGNFFTVFIEQIFITNPFVFFLILPLISTLWKRNKLQPALVVYNFIALPLIFSLFIISIFREVWYHWSGPAYVSLIPYAAIRLAEHNPKKDFPRLIKYATAFFLFILVAWPLTIHFFPGTYGSHKKEELGNGDITLDKLGWKKSGEHFAGIYKNEFAVNNAPIICSSWWGAHIEYYFARPADAGVIGIGDVYKLHQYGWLNAGRLSFLNMDTAYCILPSLEAAKIDTTYEKFYTKSELVETIPVYRQQKNVSNFYVYRLTGWTGRQPLVMRPSTKAISFLWVNPLLSIKDILW